jgi:hypothetical protein
MSNLRKRRLEQSTDIDDDSTSIDLASVATIDYSSEDPAHPVECMVDEHAGPGGTYWAAGQADTTEQLVLAFDRPQSIARVVYAVEEAEHERTQEMHIEVSTDDGRTFRRIFVQEFTFSPRGATFEREDLKLELVDVTHLRLTLVPNKHGSGVAKLTSLRLFA